MLWLKLGTTTLSKNTETQMTPKRSKTLKITAIVLAAVILFSSLLYGIYALFFDPYRDANYDVYYYGTPETKSWDTVLTKEEALADLDYAVKMLLRHHQACIDGLPSETQQMCDTVSQNMPATVTLLQFFRDLSSIFSTLHDSHSQVLFLGNTQYITDAVFYYDEDNVAVHGGQVVAEINSVDVDVLWESYLQLYSNETDSYAKNQFLQLLLNKNHLTILGVDTSDGITLTYANGETSHHEFYDEFPQAEQPTEQLPFVYYDILTESDAAVLTLDQCEPNDFYQETVKNFFTEVKQNSIGNVIVDLRANGGGDSAVLDIFLKYLPYEKYDAGYWYQKYGAFNVRFSAENKRIDRDKSLTFDGNVYILSSIYTWSSATNFVAAMKYNNFAQIVGEQSGNLQVYGELLSYSMPNSQIAFTVSNKKYFLGDTPGNYTYTLPDYPSDSVDALDTALEVIKGK
jgi:hypothetical protein